MSGRSTGRRVTMQEAADELGVTVEAIRKRVQRGTIRSDKGDDGRRYVYLDEYQTEVPLEGSELVEELRDQVHYLREQLRREQEAHGEARRIIAALTSRIPQLEAPAEPQNQAESAEPRSGRGTAPQEEETTTQRPWWRRIWG